MATATLTLSAVLAWGSAMAFLLVGRFVLRSARDAGGARLALAAFWLGSGAVAAIQGARSVSVVLGFDSFELIRALDQAATPAYTLAAAGLVYYVLFLLTGNARLAAPVIVYYLLMIPLLRYGVESAHPIGYAVAPWNVNLVYEGALASPLYTAALALAAIPVWASVLAYGTIILRLPDRALRYRVILTFAALLLWVSAEVVVWAAGLASTGAGEVSRRLIGFAVALVAGLGYAPPAHVRARLDQPTPDRLRS